MSQQTQALMTAVRQACSPMIWSRGVQLHRAHLVLGQTPGPDSLDVRVGTSQPGGRAATVSLFVDDQDWSCDCDGPPDEQSDACAHVAAAAIALHASGSSSGSGSASAAPVLPPIPQLVYAWTRTPGGLALRRQLQRGSQLTPMDSLATLYRDPSHPDRFVLAPHDHAVERALRGHRQGPLPAGLAAEVLRALVGCSSVSLDGSPIEVEAGVPNLVLRLSRRQGSLWVQAVRPPGDQVERFANGIQRQGKVLRAELPVGLPPEQLAALQRGHVVPEAKLGEFVERLLPRLRAAMPVEAAPGALPEPTVLRVGFCVETFGNEGTYAAPMDGFWTQARLLYVDPQNRICGRLEDDKLSYTGGTYPKRDPAAERACTEFLKAWGLRLGKRQLFLGAAAIAMADRLAAAAAEQKNQKKWFGTFALASTCNFRSVNSLKPRVRWAEGRLEIDFYREGFSRDGGLVGGSGAGAGLGAGSGAGVGLGAGPELVGGSSITGLDLGSGAGVGPDAGLGLGGGSSTADITLRAMENRASLVLLSNNEYAPLPQGFLAQHGQAILDILAASRSSEPLPRSTQLFAAQLLEDLGEPVPPDLQPLLAAFGKSGSLPAVEAPQGLARLLRPYQQQGINWLCALRDARLGGLLADDMGLGKTLQAVCSFRKGDHTLVVAPTSVLFNWAAELQRFRPDLDVHIYHGSKRVWRLTDVVLTSYGLMRLDTEQMTAQTWDSFVLDEAQNIKNPRSLVARAARQLPAHFRLALCGTPMENKLSELWSHFAFLNPGLLGTLNEFTERYARPIEGGVVGAAASLQRQIKPFFLRRKKSEVAADLPPRTESVLPCVLSAAERAVYEKIRAATVPSVLRALSAGGSVMQALEALLRLRQACCHPGLVPGVYGDAEAQAPMSSAKVEALKEALVQICEEGHKAIVFSQWTGFLDRIEPTLRGLEMPFLRLDGKTADRRKVVEAFQASDGPPVILISLKAGGTGLNLTEADHVFLMDPWWNPAVEDQAADRAHRIGQTRPVFVHKVIAQDTVEERILALQSSKRALTGAVLDGLDKAAVLSRDDIAELLR
jgi:hypothetical protein